MSDTTIQQNVAQYLRGLADKVEKSSYCTMESCTDKRKYVELYHGDRRYSENFPTGEREVTLKLNYIEESV